MNNERVVEILSLKAEPTLAEQIALLDKMREAVLADARTLVMTNWYSARMNKDSEWVSQFAGKEITPRKNRHQCNTTFCIAGWAHHYCVKGVQDYAKEHTDYHLDTEDIGSALLPDFSCLFYENNRLIYLW